MTSNKRYSSRDFIIKNLNYTDLKIIFSSDILIYDNWSFNFKQNLNFDFSQYDRMRNEIITLSKFDNFFKFERFENFNNLKKLSNIFVNLNNHPHWIDVFLTNSCLVLKIDFSGKISFEHLVNMCIQSIDEKFKNG